MNLTTLTYAVLGGLLPALVWLYFWQREDAKKPEPRGLLFRTFVFGALAVVLVLPFQKIVARAFTDIGVTTFLLWALLEEAFKLIAAYYGGLRSIDDDEPLDPLIYMITAALGFAALENTLFIISPLLESNVAGGVVTGSLRFIGASLLHTVSSGIIGASISLTFYKRGFKKVFAVTVGFVAAVVVHTLFNIFLMKSNSLGTFYVFSTLWGAVALLLLFFEKAKNIKS